jgi:hypothetical protein
LGAGSPQKTELLSHSIMSYDHILNSDAIDAKFEYFWYMFKNSVVAFSQKYPDDKALKNLVLRSDMLNHLKTEGKYIEIVDAIESFLEDFFWSVLYAADARYYIGICCSNLKRWFKIDRTGGPVNKEVTHELCILRVIYDALEKDNENVTTAIKAFHITFPNGLHAHAKSVVTKLIELAIENKFAPILNKICEHPKLKLQLFEYVKTMYNIDLPKCINKGPKILILLDHK